MKISELIQPIKRGREVNDQRVCYMPYIQEQAFHVFRHIGETLDKKFRIDSKNLKVYNNLIKFAHGDPEFEGDLLKGIGIVGNTGSGKTMAFEILSQYMSIDEVKWVRAGIMHKFNFNIVSSKQIISEYSKGGFAAVDKYLIPSVLCIDDLGAEIETANFFGSKINVLGYLIEERYLNRKMLHFTTNLDYASILKIYGERVESRLYEQTNFIELINPDWRKK